MSTKVVASVGGIVIAGHILNIPVFTSIHPDWVTMKLVTAFGFVVASASISLRKQGNHPDASLAIAHILFIGMLFITIASLSLRHWTLLDVGGPRQVETEAPGEPSIATLIGFLCVSLWVMTQHAAFRIAVAVASVSALLGYALRVVGIESKILFWRLPGFSTAMAVHTALLFGMLALAMKKNGADPPEQGRAALSRERR